MCIDELIYPLTKTKTKMDTYFIRVWESTPWETLWYSSKIMSVPILVLFDPETAGGFRHTSDDFRPIPFFVPGRLGAEIYKE